VGNQSGYSLTIDKLRRDEYASLTPEQYAAILGENCLTGATFGPYHQTLFLGCSVRSFTATVGWNEQIGQLTVNLVRDPCASSDGKDYWDEDLKVQSWYDADPGFVGLSYDIIGCPAMFRVQNFEFSGLIQSWTEQKSESGNPVYTVQLVDPRSILEGARVITGDYAGAILGNGWDANTGPYNLINVFGFMEAFGIDCPQTYLDTLTTESLLPNEDKYLFGDGGPDGAIFGTPSGGYGGARTNRNGMQWLRVITGLNILLNSIPISTDPAVQKYSPYGRLVFRGINRADVSNIGGFGLMGHDRTDILGPFTGLPSTRYLSDYFVDLSELPTPPAYWRINGNNISILEMISSICEDAGYDYYIELIPIRGLSSSWASSNIAKIIKIRTVRRLSQPSLGQISNFIDNAEGSLNTSRGVELRNEFTSSFVVGGKKQTLYQIEQDTNPEDGDEPDPPEQNDIIVPFFGLDANEDAIIPTKDDFGYWQFEAPTANINFNLQILEFPDTTATINEQELLAALSGYDSWLTWVAYTNTDTGQLINLNIEGGGPVWSPANFIKILKNNVLQKGEFKARDFVNLMNGVNAFINVVQGDPATVLQEDMQLLYNWVHTYASEYYGKKFMVRIPYTCARIDDESGNILTSEQPSDGGWTDQLFVLGLAVSNTLLEFFKLEDGRYGTFVRMDNANSLYSAELDPQDYGIVSKYVHSDPFSDALFVKATCDEEFVYVDKATRTSPRVVITLPARVSHIQNGGRPFRSVRLLYELIKYNLAKHSESVDTGTDTITATAHGLENDTEIVLESLKDLPAPLEKNTKYFVVQKTDDTFKVSTTKGGPPVDLTTEGDAFRIVEFKNIELIDRIFKDVGAKEAIAPMEWPSVVPDAVACGIQSNVMTYGPWVTEGPVGQIRVDIDPGLVPWEYGGFTTMNLAGQSKADEGITYMQVGERGSITVPGYPVIPLGAELGAVSGGFFGAGTNLIENRMTSTNNFSETWANGVGIFSVTYGLFEYSGKWTGIYGPNVTDITVTVAPQGVQTSYTMRTYTPRHGRFTRNNAERLKAIGQNNLKIQRAFNRALINKFNLTTASATKQARIQAIRDFGKALSSDKSPHEVLVGEVSVINSGFAENLRRTTIATMEMKELPVETYNDTDVYIRKAFMSLDGLIRPVATEAIPESNLPGYVSSVPEGNFNRGNVQYAQSPIYTGTINDDSPAYSMLIDIDYLNPFANGPNFSGSALKNRVVSESDYVGHDIDILGHGAGVPRSEDHSLSGMSLPIVGYNDTDGANYADHYRMFALRGPILLHSWGYDLDGKPVPNAADSEDDASSGIFTTGNLTDMFLSKWLRKPQTWPVAPVDLRLDRARGVWVAPQSYRLIYATLDEALTPADTSASATINEHNMHLALWDKDGNEMSGGKIEVIDVLGNTYASGDKVIAYYDTIQSSHAYRPRYVIIDATRDTGTTIRAFNTCVAESGIFDGKLTPASGDFPQANKKTWLIGNGLAVVPTGDNLLLDTYNTIKSVPTGCLESGNFIEDSRRWSNLIIGRGLGVDDGGGTGESGTNCDVRIGLSFSLDGLPNIAEIELDDCLVATRDEIDPCVATIGFATGIKPESGSGDRIWYVSNVECSGTALVVTKKWFEFSDCGTIVATGE